MSLRSVTKLLTFELTGSELVHALIIYLHVLHVEGRHLDLLLHRELFKQACCGCRLRTLDHLHLGGCLTVGFPFLVTRLLLPLIQTTIKEEDSCLEVLLPVLEKCHRCPGINQL